MKYPVLIDPATGQPAEDQSWIAHIIEQAMNAQTFPIRWIEVQPVPEWQPIETCRDDESGIWLYWPNLGAQKFRAQGAWWRKLKCPDGLAPTHWMPDTTPEPPK